MCSETILHILKLFHAVNPFWFGFGVDKTRKGGSEMWTTRTVCHSTKTWAIPVDFPSHWVKCTSIGCGFCFWVWVWVRVLKVYRNLYGSFWDSGALVIRISYSGQVLSVTRLRMIESLNGDAEQEQELRAEGREIAIDIQKLCWVSSIGDGRGPNSSVRKITTD
jgi:hypothetical protein